jgi:hypothetical protein
VIDVWGVIANSLWILGLAVLLAVLSWAHWAASTEGKRLHAVLGQHRTQQGLDLGLFLFCAGLAATGRAWWERVLWGLLAVAWVFQAWTVRIGARKTNNRETKEK